MPATKKTWLRAPSKKRAKALVKKQLAYRDAGKGNIKASEHKELKLYNEANSKCASIGKTFRSGGGKRLGGCVAGISAEAKADMARMRRHRYGDTVKELREKAKERGIKGYSKMKKLELQGALSRPRAESPAY
jgi:hypothetical protein